MSMTFRKSNAVTKSNAEVWLILREGVNQIDYAYDAAGNVSTEKWYRKGDLLLTLTYSYDANNRVTKVVRT